MQLRIAEDYLSKFGELAKAGNTFVVPANLSDLASMIALATRNTAPRCRPPRTAEHRSGRRPLGGDRYPRSAAPFASIWTTRSWMSSRASNKAGSKLRTAASRPVHSSPRAVALAELDRARRWYWEDVTRERTGRLDLYAARFAIMSRALERVGPSSPRARGGPRARAHRLSGGDCPARAGGARTPGRLRAVVPRMALVTNGAVAPQRAKIERFGLADFFDHIQVEASSVRGNPTVGSTRMCWRDLARPRRRA